MIFHLWNSRMVDVEELLIEILVRLPPECLPRFQLVSKKWFFIISSRLHTCRLPAAVTGLFFAHPRRTPPFPGPLFVSLKAPDENTQHTHQLSYRLKELCGVGPIVSLHSCNGLVCVWCLDENGSNSFYVFNPTTNQRRCIPHPPLKKRYEINAMNIAFDPSKSRHYNLVCVYKYTRSEKIGFFVFSSESRLWRKSNERLSIEFYFHNKPGAFLNGAIHWYNLRNIFLCLDVDNARVRPMPPSPLKRPGRCVYFGECRGHLHFIEQCGGDGSKLMNVFEMENNYSLWVFKYQVDLTYIQTRFFPDEFPNVGMYGSPVKGISIHFFVVDEEGKGGLVISFPRKFILYNFHDMSITQLTEWSELFGDSWKPITSKMVELPPVELSLGRYSSCTYIETLVCV